MSRRPVLRADIVNPWIVSRCRRMNSRSLRFHAYLTFMGSTKRTRHVFPNRVNLCGGDFRTRGADGARVAMPIYDDNEGEAARRAASSFSSSAVGTM